MKNRIEDQEYFFKETKKYKADSHEFSTEIVVAIPTLTQYSKLLRLCKEITLSTAIDDCISPKILILDNGGKPLRSKESEDFSKLPEISVATPEYNMGVAGSWNYFARTIGKCIIANDDVVFGRDAINELIAASQANPEAVIIENDHPIGGFSTFLLNRPDKWLQMGGFDELFNPAYFEDNDARIRLQIEGTPALKQKPSNWQHDNSSTLENGDEDYKRMHWCLFRRNQQYYLRKWGGLPGNESYMKPFTPNL